MGELAELSDENVKAARRTRTIPTSPKCHREVLSKKTSWGHSHVYWEGLTYLVIVTDSRMLTVSTCDMISMFNSSGLIWCAIIGHSHNAQRTVTHPWSIAPRNFK